MGPLFRCFNASSCEETLNIGLERIRTKFVSNGYPESIVESKIDYMIEHNFKPPKSEKDVDKIYYFRCKFTDFKCDKIAQKMRTLIQKLFPKFLFRVAFSQIKLENFIHRRLKHQLDPFEKSGLVYDFTCCCMQRYIGETKRTLRVRVQEHSTSDKNSAIYQHIRSCKKFMAKYNEYCGEPNTQQTVFDNKRVNLFTPQFFTILKHNLPNLRDRKISEALLIKLFKPPLNIKHSDNPNHRKPWNLSLPL